MYPKLQQFCLFSKFGFFFSLHFSKFGLFFFFFLILLKRRTCVLNADPAGSGLAAHLSLISWDGVLSGGEDERHKDWAHNQTPETRGGKPGPGAPGPRLPARPRAARARWGKAGEDGGAGGGAHTRQGRALAGGRGPRGAAAGPPPPTQRGPRAPGFLLPARRRHIPGRAGRGAEAAGGGAQASGRRGGPPALPGRQDPARLPQCPRGPG